MDNSNFVPNNIPFGTNKDNKFENVESQSVVVSSREQDLEQHAIAEAQNLELQKKMAQEERSTKLKKTLLLSFLVIFGLAFVATLIFLLVNIFDYSVDNRGGEQHRNEKKPTATMQIENYLCKTTNCHKVEDLPNGDKIFYDEGYYLLGKDAKDSKNAQYLSLGHEKYRSFSSFDWFGQILTVVAQESGQSALFSMSENRFITGFEYDTFCKDPNDAKIYKIAESLRPKYIIAHNASPSEYILISLRDGRATVRGEQGVYTEGNFFVSYGNDGSKQVYLPARTQSILRAKAKDEIFFRDKAMIVFSRSDYVEMRIMNSNGEEVYMNDLSYGAELEAIPDDSSRLEYARASDKFTKLPQ